METRATKDCTRFQMYSIHIFHKWGERRVNANRRLRLGRS